MTDAPATPHGERGHSPLGASGAERWMSCPGSATLIRELELPETDDPSYRIEGTAMHEAAEYCLNNSLDTWEIVGQKFGDMAELPAPMLDAVQVYLDYVRQFMGDDWTHYVEYKISSPVHPLFYGMADFGGVRKVVPLIRVVDLKGGEGIIVDPDANPQLQYYAYGLIDGLERSDMMTFPDDTPVILAIAQPRGLGVDEMVREWTTTVGEIKRWVNEELVPAMIRTEFDHTLDAGPWCRFCPAKLVCPLLSGLYKAAASSDPSAVKHVNDDTLARDYMLLEAVGFYKRALETEMQRRFLAGHTPGEGQLKLVQKKSNRVLPPKAQKLAVLKFGDKAMNPATVKTPAQLDALGAGAKEWVKEYAFQPNTGYTVALASDRRAAVKVRPASETFKAAIAALGES